MTATTVTAAAVAAAAKQRRPTIVPTGRGSIPALFPVRLRWPARSADDNPVTVAHQLVAIELVGFPHA